MIASLSFRDARKSYGSMEVIHGVDVLIEVQPAFRPDGTAL